MDKGHGRSCQCLLDALLDASCHQRHQHLEQRKTVKDNIMADVETTTIRFRPSPRQPKFPPASSQDAGHRFPVNGLVNGSAPKTTDKVLGGQHGPRSPGYSRASAMVKASHGDRPPPHRSLSDRNSRWPQHGGQRLDDPRGHSGTTGTGNGNGTGRTVLYRSNSSLELDQELLDAAGVAGALRREYGSASSIDVMSTSGESFFAMLRDYGGPGRDGFNFDQRSPGPARIAEYLRGKVEAAPSTQNAANVLVLANGSADAIAEHACTSPKIKTKFHKLWEGREKSRTKEKGAGAGSGGGNDAPASFFRKLRGGAGNSGGSGGGGGGTGSGNNGNKGDGSKGIDVSSKGSTNSLESDGKLEERLRRRSFAHYDVQSITANLSCAARLRNVLSRRRNTCTGASAASNNCAGGRGTPHGSTEDLGGSEDTGVTGNQSAPTDTGDGKNNELILGCPYFRNELGGELERNISLTRIPSSRGYRRRFQNVDGGGPTNNNNAMNGNSCGTDHTMKATFHRPNITCGLSVLEGASNTYLKGRDCPYQRHHWRIECVDQGALYYKQYFYGQEHQNWFGIDDQLGPVAVSIRREKIDENGPVISSNSAKDTCSPTSQYQYRLIIRTSELATLRGTVLEDCIPTLKQGGGRGIHAKEVIECIAPELQMSCLRLGTSGTQTEDQLLKLDQQGLTNHYKVGIMYCKAGQGTEEEMYNNEHAGPAFDEFLDMIGQRVRLKGFDKYRAQLDNKMDSTGLYSVYATFQQYEVMFHVSTMLPYTPNNRQQLLRKRHIGNDIVTIVFQEPDALPFTPRSIRSHFQHVFIIVRAVHPCSDNTRYMVSVGRSKEVPVFGPPIPEGATFPKSKSFAEFLLAKVINAENAAHRSEKFAIMASRTRQEYLKDLSTNYVTAATIDLGPKFSIISFGGKKKDRARPRFIPDNSVRGAIVWNVQVDDYGQSTTINCSLGISCDTIVLLEEGINEVVFSCPTSSVLGWTSQSNSLKMYHHQGECVVIHLKDLDETLEIVNRLSCVTAGHESLEYTLRRNNLGQLGFHIQPDGIVTEVECHGLAWQAGLRQNYRLVEICKVVLATLSHDQMVDLLKTSVTVTVTAIPPLDDGTPPRGCSLHNCNFLCGLQGSGDYENVNGTNLHDNLSRMKSSARQQVAHSSSRTNSSPLQSTPSSGYSSRKSVTINLEHRIRNSELTSASSQSSEEKWYDTGEMPDITGVVRSHVGGESPPPPPLPARLASTCNTRRHEAQHGRHVYAHLPPTPSRAVQNHSHSMPPPPPPPPSHSHSYVPRALAEYSQVKDAIQTQAEHARQLRTLSSQYLPSSIADRHKATFMTSPALAANDRHSDGGASEPGPGSKSEDEHSGSGSSVSPYCLPRHIVSSSSNNSSRNQSPRSGSDREARLRTVPGNRHLGRSGQSNCTESTLQEDLLKLINPELINSEDDISSKSLDDSYHRAGSPPPLPVKANSSDLHSMSSSGSSSRGLKQTSTSEEAPLAGDVIFTTARPATVISSSSSSSPAPSENKHPRDERQSPRTSSSNSNGSSRGASKSLPPFPKVISSLMDSAADGDWPMLNENAVQSLQGPCNFSASTESLTPWIGDLADRLGLDTLPVSQSCHLLGMGSRRVRELEQRVRGLEEELAQERNQKVALELEVQRLRDENSRLQEESRTAAAQLRKFTEWFFRNIDK